MILSAGIDKFWLHIIIVNHCVWAILLLLVKQSLNLLPLTNAWTQGWWNLIWFNNHCSQLSWHWWGWWHYGLEYQYQILVFTGRQYLLRMWFTQNYVNSDWGVWPTLLKERVLPPPGHPWSPAAPRNHSQRTQSTWNAQKSVLPRAPLFSPLWTW